MKKEAEEKATHRMGSVDDEPFKQHARNLLLQKLVLGLCEEQQHQHRQDHVPYEAHG